MSTQLSTIVTDGQVTHVVVPIDDYERLMISAMAERALHVDPNAKRMSTAEVGRKLAGDRIRKAREALSMTREGLAVKIDVPARDIARAEDAPVESDVSLQQKLAEHLSVNIDALIGHIKTT